MTARLKTLALAICAPLILMGCVLVPGKFVSVLTIDADRSFTFTYQGEVIGIDFANEFEKSMGSGLFDGLDEDETPEGAAYLNTAFAQDDPAPADKKAGNDAKYRAIADALRKEPGYRSVEYKGDGVFAVDYAASGSLTHNFVYPYNIDAEIIFPFIAVELRGKDVVRVKAPAFGNNERPTGLGSDNNDAKDRIDGIFTLITNAEIVSQNTEDGATTQGDRRKIAWTVTPLSKDAPMAVLKVQPLR